MFGSCPHKPDILTCNKKCQHYINQNQLDYIDNRRLFRYIENGCFRELKVMEFDQVNDKTMTKIKFIVNNYLDIGKRNNVISNDVVLIDVVKNPHDATQVEIMFGRKDYKSSIFL
jgi:hypothetical protein